MLIDKIFKNYDSSIPEKVFIERNKNDWKANENPVGILIEGLLESPTSVIEKSRISKALEEATSLSSLVILRGLIKSNNKVSDLYGSFGINKTVMWWLGYLNPFLSVKCSFSAFKLMRKINSGQDITREKRNGILIGDLIYDTLIRFIPNSYTVNEVSFRKHFRLIFRAYYFFERNEMILNKYNIKYLVSSHNVYAEFGLLCRQAHSHGASVYIKDGDVFNIYKQSDNILDHVLRIDASELEIKLKDTKILRESEVHYLDRINGKSTQSDAVNAFKNKHEYSFKDLLELFPTIDENKTNVFVMSHAFSDAPHVGGGLLFKDYYDFLEKTLCALNVNSNVNCFVKAHPSSFMWSEEGSVENIVKINNLGNVSILPCDFNAKSIKDIADVIVTAKGTAGLEFSCAGIPAVTAGRGYYSGFDIAVEPKGKEEYFDVLNSLHELKPLEEDVIIKAKVLFYLSFSKLFHSKVLPVNQIRPGESLTELFSEKINEINLHLNQGHSMKDEFYAMVANSVDDREYEK